MQLLGQARPLYFYTLFLLILTEIRTIFEDSNNLRKLNNIPKTNTKIFSTIICTLIIDEKKK